MTYLGTNVIDETNSSLNTLGVTRIGWHSHGSIQDTDQLICWNGTGEGRLIELPSSPGDQLLEGGGLEVEGRVGSGPLGTGVTNVRMTGGLPDGNNGLVGKPPLFLILRASHGLQHILLVDIEGSSLQSHLNMREKLS